ncbi:MAG: hypothetical protein K9G58_13730 [Bacteroidales bacterium]|nr:hypothetical protein [Bacteroidales bacterium]MCF8388790.1 hypothetical protein [Bacteroidales bacterium]MCF8399230.1 hypothetical protein [Bacteroidales bacterium]
MSNNWIERFKDKWDLKSTWQVVIILIVFACTGFSVLYLEAVVVRWLKIPEDLTWWLRAIVFIFLTLPLYNILLLLWGFVFGQFKWFWNYEKIFFRRIGKLFKKKHK